MTTFKTAEDFFKEHPYCERKPIESKPVLSLVNWNLFNSGRGYEMASGVMASDGHPYIRRGKFVTHTSAIFNKTVEEDGTIVCETVNSVYKLVGPKWEPKSVDFLYLTENINE